MAKSKSQDDENSVALNDDAFVGVSPEYKNYANEQDAPLRSEDPVTAGLEEAAVEDMRNKAHLASRSDVNGYVAATPHPSEAKGPVDRIIERNDTITEAMASSAGEHLAEKQAAAGSAEEEDGGAGSPSGIASTS